MPRNQDESPEQYKERILDPISPSFCAAKWLNATIMLGSGMTKSCHHPPEHQIPVREVQVDVRALHNTRHKRNQRRRMLDGKRPTECSYCWRVEDSGAIADRVFYTSFYEDKDIAECGEMPWDTMVTPQVLEISFDRICNFACSYCNPTFSTTWAKDIKKHGPYKYLKTDNGKQAFQKDGSWAEPYGKMNEGNPWIEAFWEWWPELRGTLTQLRVTGGEPTMSPHFWKLIDMIAADGIPDELQFSVNTNLGMKDDILDRLIAASHTMKRFMLFTSCEAHGAQAEYIRDGLDYKAWKRNVWRVAEEANVEMMNCMMAVNGLSLFSITDMWDDLMELKTEYNWRFPFLSVNFVHYPSFMSPLLLPEHIRQERKEHIEGWLAQYDGDPRLRDTEVYNIRKLITYLDNGKEGAIDANREAHERDFMLFHHQYDQRRGKDIKAVFPEPFVEWFEELERKYG